MAASIVIPSPRSRDARGIAARAAARSAPRGPGLATVVALPVPGASVSAAAGPVATGERAPTLRVVAPVEQRPRKGARIGALVTVAALLVGGVSGIVSGALTGPSEPTVAGHVVLQPGETLWDVAVRSAPVGIDPRRQLETLRRLNGFGPGALDAWTVVLIPAT
jgi:hypothetical protein